MNDGLKSRFQKPKDTSKKAGEQPSLPHRSSKLPPNEKKKSDDTRASNAQSTRAGLAQSTSLRAAEEPGLEQALDMSASSVTQTIQHSVMESGSGTTSTSRPGSAQPGPNNDDLPISGAFDTIPTAANNISEAATWLMKPISELWNEAYEELQDKEKSLMKEYETAMSKDMMAILGSTSLALGAPAISVRRKEQAAALVKKKVDEAKKNAWKLTYGDNEVLLKDLAEPVVNIINSAEKFIDGAVSANPYASVA